MIYYDNRSEEGFLAYIRNTETIHMVKFSCCPVIVQGGGLLQGMHNYQLREGLRVTSNPEVVSCDCS